MDKKYSFKDQCDDIVRHVEKKIAMLQGMYLSPATRSSAARSLAILRRGVTKGPGSSLDMCTIEYEDLPASLVGTGKNPSYGEQAVHVALALYAVHQQSQTKEMHRVGSEYDIGAAVQQYLYINKGFEGLKDGQLPRRFAAMSTADSIDELAYHARQLVHLLRSASLPIDYGRFARQLLEFQIPTRRDTVRLEWGRAFAQTKEKIVNQSNTARQS